MIIDCIRAHHCISTVINFETTKFCHNVLHHPIPPYIYFIMLWPSDGHIKFTCNENHAVIQPYFYSQRTFSNVTVESNITNSTTIISDVTKFFFSTDASSASENVACRSCCWKQKNFSKNHSKLKDNLHGVSSMKLPKIIQSQDRYDRTYQSITIVKSKLAQKIRVFINKKTNSRYLHHPLTIKVIVFFIIKI